VLLYFKNTCVSVHVAVNDESGAEFESSSAGIIIKVLTPPLICHQQ